MADESVDLGRRGFLRGRRRAEPAPLRLPWARTERFTDLCTRCGACADACPEGIIRRGDGGFPEVDFRRSECSFCAACADSCPEPVFDRAAASPWTLAVRIGPSCLAINRVVCRSCRDACPESAIRFALAPGGVAVPVVENNACTGCGACLAACPADAVTLQPGPETAHAP
ncbi:ferredoxin (plasmid) [Azospirillum argentinense]|uniref:Ferredoxin-type protein NapF n=1 Tax=Azospirillum argentinense TaxID=2970906 RepID=A0A060DLS2_9PROT|nr:ferredoxin-type protein NapF [Azospirillum argentinense]AIB14886.1 ferredoxin [Azospirillum argentinense]EZQ04388.1 ferredoxin [Azospirillum argentinense]PNQ97526.1 ferredoxin-type protein NapF [Azospirillum argentinense]